MKKQREFAHTRANVPTTGCFGYTLDEMKILIMKSSPPPSRLQILSVFTSEIYDFVIRVTDVFRRVLQAIYVTRRARGILHGVCKVLDILPSWSTSFSNRPAFILCITTNINQLVNCKMINEFIYFDSLIFNNGVRSGNRGNANVSCAARITI